MINRLSRRTLLQASAASLAAPFTGLALAQDKFPSKPIRIIVPLPAGGVADNSVRALGNALQPILGQPLVVDNKPGGTFVIAMGALQQAPADGYTLFHINAALLSAQAVFKRFDVFKQLVPVAGLGDTDVTISVSGKTPYKNIRELIDFARAHPGKLNYVSPGPGTLEHLALSNFCKQQGIDAVHVPLKGGPDVVKALIQGDADFGTLAVPFIQQFGASGQVRALVLLNNKPNRTLKNIPTLTSEKLDLGRLTIWGGIAAPAGTPPAIVAQLERAILQANGNAELQKFYASSGLDSDPINAAEFGKTWHEDYAWIAKAVSDAKLSLN